MKLTFHLRHLLIAEALFAVLFSWLAYEWNMIHKRKQMRAELLETWDGLNLRWQGHVTLLAVDADNVTWIRRMLGDENEGTVYIPTSG
jgi:hypothetical protein